MQVMVIKGMRMLFRTTGTAMRMTMTMITPNFRERPPLEVRGTRSSAQ